MQPELLLPAGLPAALPDADTGHRSSRGPHRQEQASGEGGRGVRRAGLGADLGLAPRKKPQRPSPGPRGDSLYEG